MKLHRVLIRAGKEQMRAECHDCPGWFRPVTTPDVEELRLLTIEHTIESIPEQPSHIARRGGVR